MPKKVSELTKIDSLAAVDDFYVHDASAPTNLSSKRATTDQIADYVSSSSALTENIQDITGAMFTGNTETGVTITYQDADGTIDVVVSDTTFAGDSGSIGITPGDTFTITGGTNITTSVSGDAVTITNDYTDESIQDLVGAMVTGNTETLISVTYQDADGTMDFVVDNDLSNYDNSSSAFITASSTDTLTNKSGDISQWTNDSGYITATLTQEQVEDFAGAMWTGNTETGISITYQDADGTIDAIVSDTTVAGDSGSTGITPGDTLTIAGGTNATTAMSGDTLTVNVDDAFLLNNGDVGTGVYDFGGATSFEIPNGATPTVDAAGEIAVDTTIADYTGLIKYHDGVEELTVVAMPTGNLNTTDTYAVTYDAAENEFTMTAQSGSGGGIDNVVEDTTPQLGGQLDVNGNAIGDGTNELITFTEDASAVNNVNIENEAMGSGPIISAAGDDTNIDLNLNGKATGNVIIRDGTDVSKELSIELSGATTGTATTLTASQTGNVTVTLPDASDTLVGKATTDTLTNKTFDANGTGNSLSNVDVADLADGTDGELITWDSSGSPATVGAGTANQVLTSNGAGAAPTFQDASSGGGAWSFEETTTASSSATLNWTDLAAGTHVFIFDNILPATDAVDLTMVASSDSGGSPTFASTNYQHIQLAGSATDTSPYVDNSVTASEMILIGEGSGDAIGNAGSGSNEYGLSGFIYVYNVNTASSPIFLNGIITHQDPQGDLIHSTISATSTDDGAGGATVAVKALRILMSSGDVASGSIHHYTIAES